MRSTLNLLGPFLGLAIVLAIFSWLNYQPDRPFVYLSADNVKKVAIQTTILATCGIGMTLVIISGGIDLSIGSVVALANVVVVLVFNGQFLTSLRETFFRGNDAAAWIAAAILSLTVFVLEYQRSKSLLSPVVALTVSWLIGWLAFAGSGAVAAFCAGTLIGLACGWINGLLVTSTGVVPFIITLGTMEVFRGLTLLIAKETKVDVSAEARKTFQKGGENVWFDQLMTELPDPPWLQVGPGVWFMLIAALVTVVVLSRMKLGRFIFAIGSNEEAGRLSGLPVGQIKRWVYCLSGLAAGLAGVMQFSRLSTGVPTDSVGLELDVIAAVVIGGGSLRGGEGSIVGTLIGAFILGFMKNGCVLAGIPNPVQKILIGSLIILAVALDEWRYGQRRA
jgi:ribose/xylose/arabinose/galactoside ABC-type transport system permease subunit